MENNDKISIYQVGVLQFLTIVGVGILSMPSAIAASAENDAWIATIVAGIVNIILVFIISRVVIKYGKYGLVGACRHVFGKVLGTILVIPTILEFTIFTTTALRIFGETAKLYLLPKTRIEYIIIPMILITYLLVRSGVEPIARFYELVLPFTIAILIGIIILMLPNSEYSDLRPFLSSSFPGFLNGIKSSMYAFLGFEIILVIGNNIKTPKKVFKASFIAISSVTLIYTIFVIQCIVRLGLAETKHLIYPIVSVLKASDVPGAFLERIEGLMLALWVLLVFTTVASYSYMSAVTISDVFCQKNIKYIATAFIPVIYVAALQGESIVGVTKIADAMSLYLGGYTILILPLLILLFGKLLKKENG